MMRFHEIEIPVAKKMIELAVCARHPFQKYFCYWAAFNNIYTLVAKRLVKQNVVPNGKWLISQLMLNNGAVVFTNRPKDWGYRFPRVSLPGERNQIQKTITQINPEIKDALIMHPNVSFFVSRILEGVSGQYDTQGQLINGVLNITQTVEAEYPVWSPIDQIIYEGYINGNHCDQDRLAEQIIFMLYTIRNNLLHGSKSPGEENDLEVVGMALPLLKMVVRSFIRH